MKTFFLKAACGVQIVLLICFAFFALYNLPVKWEWQTTINIPIPPDRGETIGHGLEIKSFVPKNMFRIKEPDKKYLEIGLSSISRRYMLEQGTKTLDYRIIKQTDDFFVYELFVNDDSPTWTVSVSFPRNSKASIAVIKSQEASS